MDRPNATLLLMAACTAVAFATLPASARGATIEVPGDQPTIQAAVDAAAPGDTIRVAPGDYHEQVRVTGAKDGVTIEAADPAHPPVIHGAPNQSNDGIRVDRVDDLTIRNIHIIGAYDGVRLNSARRALVVGLYIEDNALGVRVNQGEDNRVEQCTIVSSRVEQGILVDSSDAVILARNVVIDSEHGGVRVRNSPCAVLDRNEVIDNRGSDGIKVEDSDGARIVGCMASRNYRNGILVRDSHDLVLLDNTADDNRNLGFRIDHCFPFETAAEVASAGNSGAGNGQGEIFVDAPPDGSGGTPPCPPPATPTATVVATPTASSAPPGTPGPTHPATPGGPPSAEATPTATPTPTGSGAPAGTPGPPASPAPPAATGTAPAPHATSTPAPSDALHCRRAVARASGKFAKTRVLALKKCAARLLDGRLGPDPGPGARLSYCRSEPRTAAKIAKARGRLGTAIDRVCGGPNALCGDADDHLDMQVDLGFPVECPDLNGAGCTHALTDCGSVASCLACIHDAGIDAAIALYYDDLVDAQASAPDPSLGKCQQTIGKETAKYLLTRTKVIGKCWHDRFKGRHAEQCPMPKSQAKLVRADARRIARICSACGGGDANCDEPVAVVAPEMPPLGGSAGADDLTPSVIGFVEECPQVTIPADPVHDDTVCGGPVSTLADLVFCVGCVTEFVGDCGDRSGLPGLVSYPAACRGAVPTATPSPGA